MSEAEAIEIIRVPYGQTVHGEEEINAVVNVLRTSTQMGKHVRDMQDKVAALFAKKYGVMVNSGSSANYLAVEILGLEAGSEVITPVVTFATTVAPLIKNKLVPAFVDVQEGTYNIDVDKIEEMLTPKTRAMIIPSLLGNLPDWDAIARIAAAHNLIVIEDSCDTLGATLNGTSTGTRSHISTTSFYGNHVINCAGNGGMLCMSDDAFAEKALLLRSWGRSSSLFVESEKIENRFDVDIDGMRYDRKFIFDDVGYNLEPSEMGAAFGLVQLSKLGHFIKLRNEFFSSHLQFFGQYENWFILPKQLEGAHTGWMNFPLTVREDAPFTRTELQIFLEKQNIQTRPIFTGNVLRQPGFKHIERKESKGGYAQADKIMRGGILLGCHHGLDEKKITHIYSTFKKFVESL
jgi:CDP-6-deoxy-D-xylo-4-hexulose-3-dehydrase